MSRNTYSTRDQYSNLQRQDNRLNLNDEQMDDSSVTDSEYLQTTFDTYQDSIDEFKSLPKCLKTTFITLAKKHAALKCRILNNNNQISKLNHALTTGDFPRSIQFQIRSFEKRYNDVATISNLTSNVIESEKTRLNQQNQDTKLRLLNGPTELNEIIKPIIDNSDTFKHMLNNSEMLLNSLIEQEFCTMLLKIEYDKKVKESKKAKLEAQKALNNSPALITSKHFKQMTNQVKQLKKELTKLSINSKQKKWKRQTCPEEVREANSNEKRKKLKRQKKKWKFQKYAKGSSINLSEFIALTTTIPSSSPNIFFNLTSHNLDQFQSILNLGIKHIPCPIDTNADEVKKDVESFINKIAWKEYFSAKNFHIDSTFDPTFKLPSKHFPFSTPNQHLKVKTELLKAVLMFEKSNKDNTTPRKNPTIELSKFLNNNPDIRLVLSDKNLGVVAIPTIQYNNLVMNHLQSDKYQLIGPNHSLFFQPFNQRLSRDFLQIMNLIVENELNPDIIKYAKHYRSYHNWKIPNFHVLIKLHKGLNPLKSRPIVSAVNWFTSPVSKILSKKILPLFQNQSHVAKNSMEVGYSIAEFNLLPRNHRKKYLVTLDITDLYTNIDLTRLQQLLTNHDPYFAKLMNFVCDNNYLSYHNSVYKQTNGIAMGTNCAPELANFYLLKLLDPILIENSNVSLYKRYLDDLFFMWNGSSSELANLVTNLRLSTGLGFTMNASKKSVDFLDLKIFYQNEYLEHCTHQKQLNKYGYISPASCHPKHTFSGFIKGELTRYAINSSKLEFYLITKRLFYQRLLNRGYQRRFLDMIFKKHKYQSRYASSRQKPDETLTTTLSLRYSFNRNLQNLSRTLKVRSNYFTRKFLPEHNTRISWKRSRNLFDILCSSPLTAAQALYLTQQASNHENA